MKARLTWLALGAVGLLAASVSIPRGERAVASGDRERAAEEPARSLVPRAAPKEKAPRAPSAETTLASAPRSRATPAPDAATAEAITMTTLRELGLRDPERSLRLVHEAESKFGDSGSAAERAWFEVRALVELRRMDEALVESQTLVEKWPNDPFALDVARHMLTHPMTDPGETGFR